MTQSEVTTTVSTDMNTTEENERRYRMREGKVFSYLVDQAAFVDTISLSVDSDQKPRLNEITDQESVGILSRHSNYSRKVTGRWKVTENPVTILYGKVNRFSSVPPCRLTVRSESLPVTGAQVNKLAESIFTTASDVRVSRVELTFDVSNCSFSQVLQSAVYRAIHTEERTDRRGRQTFYVGSPRSLWFACVYEKKEGVLRIEFRLRRGFLSAYGLNHPDDLVALRTLRLSKLISLREFSNSRIMAATQSWPSPARDWCQRSGTRPLWLLHRVVSSNGLDANRLLPKSTSQRQLESMLRQLVW
jgi:hypothetical protein